MVQEEEESASLLGLCQEGNQIVDILNMMEADMSLQTGNIYRCRRWGRQTNFSCQVSTKFSNFILQTVSTAVKQMKTSVSTPVCCPGHFSQVSTESSGDGPHASWNGREATAQEEVESYGDHTNWVNQACSPFEEMAMARRAAACLSFQTMYIKFLQHGLSSADQAFLGT